MRHTHDTKLIEYNDWVASVSLWWKSLFLLPLWAFIPAALLGAIAWRLGGVFVEIGYVLVLLLGVWYFLEDLLKRKIKIEDGVLYLGSRRHSLATLESLRVIYDPKRIIPQALLFSFQNKARFHLYLSRLQAKDIQFIVDLIDSRFPHCKVDPVLRHLARCHDLAPILTESDDGPTVLDYQESRLISELKDSFLTMCQGWSRPGPAIAWLLFSSVWLATTFGIFSAFKIIDETPKSSIQDALAALARFLTERLGETMKVMTEGASNLATNQIVGIVLALVAIVLLSRILSSLLKPNRIRLEEEEITLEKRIFIWDIGLKAISWSKIARATLVSGEKTESSNEKIILLDASGNQLTELSLSGLAQRARKEFYKRLKRYAPECTIEPHLAEALMPQQKTSYTELWLQSLHDSPERKNLEPLSCGHRLRDGRYEVVTRLGVGGQGAAYLSREQAVLDDQHCQDVVLKETILPVFVEDSIRRQYLERFEHEARMLETINHEHIVEMKDFFVEDHRGYLVLEHLEGENLRQLAEGQPLSVNQVRDLLPKMCELLTYLHSIDVIHRDFTPDNLILTRSGDLKLIDFNVAQLVKTGMTGTVVGKHAYVPPEQFRGKPSKASDLYALGCTLYFLLTGKDPEPLTTSSLKDSSIEESDTLETIIGNCTALKEQDRYSGIEEIVEELKNAGESSDALTLSLSQSKRQKEPEIRD